MWNYEAFSKAIHTPHLLKSKFATFCFTKNWQECIQALRVEKMEGGYLCFSEKIQ